MKEILVLSETGDGRKQIDSISPYIISSYLMEMINTRWHSYKYWIVDNLALKILTNLVSDPIFFREATNIKQDLIRLINRHTGNQFWNLCRTVINNINAAEKKKMDETPL